MLRSLEQLSWVRRVSVCALLVALSLPLGACGGDPRGYLGNPSEMVDGPAGEEVNDVTPAGVEGSVFGREVEIRVDAHETTPARIWRPQGGTQGVGILFVTGVDGGFIDPVDGIYSRLADRFVQRGVPSIFIQYRQAGVLEPSVVDALAGVAWLKRQGVSRIAIVGWSFGGAVITSTPLRAPEIVTAVGIAPQSRETEAVALFRHQSLLLLHSLNDENVPYELGAPVILSEAPASIKKELVTYEEEDHYLSGAGYKVDPKIESWLQAELGLGRVSRPPVRLASESVTESAAAAE